MTVNNAEVIEKVISKNEEFITSVNNSIDIVETIKKYIPLEQSLSYFVGKCPFDDTCGNSLTVSSEKKSFYCFGCHKSGYVVDFVARFGSMNKFTAARFLKKTSNVSHEKKEVGENYVNAEVNRQ